MNKKEAEKIYLRLLEKLGNDYFVDGGFYLGFPEIREDIIKALVTEKDTWVDVDMNQIPCNGAYIRVDPKTKKIEYDCGEGWIELKVK